LAKFSILSAMKIALTMLCGGLLLGVGCGGDDEPDPGLGTASLKQPAEGGGNAGGNTPAPPKKKQPMKYRDLVRRPGAVPHVVGTNKITRFYYFTSGTNRFTGLAVDKTTNGLFTVYAIRSGMLNGKVKQKFANSTNYVSERTYTNGLQQGIERHWHRNGRLRMHGHWTNGVRHGHWLLLHDDGSTNRMDLYDMGAWKGKHPVFVSQGLTMEWTSQQLQQVYVGKPLSTIQRMFGSPDKIVKGGWVYYNVKVNGAVPNKAAVTTTFVHQAGKVTLVQFAP